jgi:hypothetical protein
MDDITDKSNRAGPSAPSLIGRADLERWLVADVVPVFDAMEANPDRAIPARQVAAALDDAHTEWMKNAKRGA